MMHLIWNGYKHGMQQRNDQTESIGKYNKELLKAEGLKLRAMIDGCSFSPFLIPYFILLDV